ncbi:MAG: aminotransferase class I/II-fold pyridoxal phosphate-dependent enzyme [Anaerovoracaceae bacterium]
MKEDIRTFLERHRAAKPVSFHMPGHKGMEIFEENGCAEELKNIADWDITEISGADNLFQPESIIARTMEKYRQLYGVKKSYLLINGSSAGIIAAVMAALGHGGQGSLILARNSHKSVYNSLRLAGARPVYVYPQMISGYGIQGRITAEAVAEAMDREPQGKAVILPSPNYYGICSDISAIADVVHRRGKVLIVDQAHGAHLKFFRGCHAGSAGPGKDEHICRDIFPPAAEDQGADIVINSTHKTLASFTQTAVLNVCSDRVDTADLEDCLQMIESTSPSYPLMATLDMNADLLLKNGPALFERWAENIRWFYEKAQDIKGLRLMRADGLDPTKINLDMSYWGFDGERLEKFLIQKGIYPELVSGNIVMCMSGIGNKREDYEKLAGALEQAAQAADGQGRAAADDGSGRRRSDFGSGWPGVQTKEKDTEISDYSFDILVQAGIPVKRRSVKLSEAEGMVCAGLLIPYPPGIPIACPGEILTRQVIDRIMAARRAGRKVIGVSPEMEILVGAD